MKITNRYNVPEPLYRAIVEDDYQRVGDISMTQVIEAPQMIELVRRHDDQIEVDASELIYPFLGKMAHLVVERAAYNVDNVLSEERLTVDVGGWTLSGKADLYEDGGRISDWKLTSVWSFVFGIKREWIAQTNGYAHLFRAAGFPVRELEIVALLRDWNKREAVDHGGEYPQAAFVQRQVPLWTPREAADLVSERVRMHKRAREDGIWEPCTPEERWARPDSWAVFKGEQKKAAAVFGAGFPRGGGEVDAHVFAEELRTKAAKKTTARVLHRPGRNIRCELYCHAAPWCEQLKHLKEEQAAREVAADVAA